MCLYAKTPHAAIDTPDMVYNAILPGLLTCTNTAVMNRAIAMISVMMIAIRFLSIMIIYMLNKIDSGSIIIIQC